ncbi:MAG: hypothetical protein ORN49_12390 [Rhodobacteraceae bacterium]|nr:hypothetical protein [Paracoccaceae bacterium]
MTYKVALLCAAVAALSACVPDPKQFETPPVKVQTPQGVVTCQLYSKRLLTWDRAIDFPQKMTVKQADAYCHAEGAREKKL